MEQTLIILKPDAVQRGLIGEIVSRFEKKGFRIAAMKMLTITPELARRHYVDHLEKPFYPPLEKYITGAPTVVLILEGEGVIASVRLMVGPTNGLVAPPGTIRGDFATDIRHNLVHASDSEAAAMREIGVFFG
ncbi:MAG TPA: nucleoside-diphosphate kinase [Planctomycetaceae bacterium]|nr:nucleoside-diphosphate kinase [Planctomycetaceae bacterium]